MISRQMLLKYFDYIDHKIVIKKLKRSALGPYTKHTIYKIYINNKIYSVMGSHIVWFFNTNEIIDHKLTRESIKCIDGDLSNINFNNLKKQSISERTHSNNKTKKITTSIYKGVAWHKKKQLWQVYINGCYVGRYSDEVFAANVYNKKALELWGSDAKLNDCPYINVGKLKKLKCQ